MAEEQNSGCSPAGIMFFLCACGFMQQFAKKRSESTGKSVFTGKK